MTLELAVLGCVLMTIRNLPSAGVVAPTPRIDGLRSAAGFIRAACEGVLEAGAVSEEDLLHVLERVRELRAAMQERLDDLERGNAELRRARRVLALCGGRFTWTRVPTRPEIREALRVLDCARDEAALRRLADVAAEAVYLSCGIAELRGFERGIDAVREHDFGPVDHNAS